MSINDFDEVVNVRLSKDQVRDIDRVFSKDRFKFSSRSHFIRVAILKLVREESKKFK